MTNPTQHPAACSEARKRRDEAHAATGATNSPNMDPSATGPENGAEGVEAIRARVEAARVIRQSVPGELHGGPHANYSPLFIENAIANHAPGETDDPQLRSIWQADAEIMHAAFTDIPMLLAELDAANATIKRVEAQAATWESNAIDGADLYCAHKVRAALASPDAGDQVGCTTDHNLPAPVHADDTDAGDDCPHGHRLPENCGLCTGCDA